MPVAAALRESEATVDPGQKVAIEINISNAGTIVEQFSLEVLGDVAPWSEVVPPNLSLFPGTEQVATVRFSPPRQWSTKAGVVPFAVKVTPSNEPDNSVVEEGFLTVNQFNDVAGELVPRICSGRLYGRQRLAVDNRGNVAVPAVLSATDPSTALAFRFRPEKLELRPGQAAFTKVRIKPHQRFWRGPAKTKPYKVQITPEGMPVVTVDGTFTHKSLLFRGALPLLVLAGLAAAWFLLFKPAIQSTATSAVTNQIAAQQAQTGALASQLASTNSAVKSLSSTTTTTTSTTSTTTTTTTTLPVSTTTTGPAQSALTVAGAPGQTTNNSYTVPTGGSLSITDIVFENVSKSDGRARLERIPTGTGATPQNLLVEDLDTLTDQEYRFTTPIAFTAGQQVVLSVDCQSDQPACDVNLFYTGQMSQTTTK